VAGRGESARLDLDVGRAAASMVAGAVGPLVVSAGEDADGGRGVGLGESALGEVGVEGWERGRSGVPLGRRSSNAVPRARD